MFNKKNKIQSSFESKNGTSLVTVTKPNDIISEQFRTIRTNIQYSMVDKEFKTIMVTSSSEKEGKSTVSANLASVMADVNKKVLIIDADMRKPTLHKTFNLNSGVGLTSLLTDKELEVLSIIQYSEDSKLYLLPVGAIPPNPAELLDSASMRSLINELEDIFDLIIIDTPPILAVTDAQIVADLVDGVIFVIREGIADKRGVKKSIELLNVTGANIIGSVYNAADVSKSNGYYGYSYGYGNSTN